MVSQVFWYNFPGDGFHWTFGFFLTCLTKVEAAATGETTTMLLRMTVCMWNKNSVVHFDGTLKLAEEYEERAMLGFQTLSTAESWLCGEAELCFAWWSLDVVPPESRDFSSEVVRSLQRFW